MRDLNKDYQKRNQIIFGDDNVDGENWLGGCRHFSNLSLEQLEELVANKFIDLQDAQNCSPTVEDFLGFMKDHTEFTAHGYAVSHNRDDYRVSLEGIEFDGRVTSDRSVQDFVYLCRHADEFVWEDNKLYAWWD
jgi:hypothetical protein